MRTQFRILAVLVCMLGAQTVHAGPPTDSMKSRISQVRSLLAKTVKAGSSDADQVDEDLRKVIEPVLDFNKMSENALRAHWAGLATEKRSEFILLFRALLFRTYLQRIRTADEDYSLEFESEEAKSRKAAAVTVIAQTRKAEIELVFHLTTQNGRIWVAEDVVIDEVSLVENYREQFNRIIKKDGYSALLQKMANKLVELGGTIPDGVVSVSRPKTPSPKSVQAPTQSEGKAPAPKAAPTPSAAPSSSP